MLTGKHVTLGGSGGKKSYASKVERRQCLGFDGSVAAVGNKPNGSGRPHHLADEKGKTNTNLQEEWKVVY